MLEPLILVNVDNIFSPTKGRTDLGKKFHILGTQSDGDIKWAIGYMNLGWGNDLDGNMWRDDQLIDDI